MAVMSVTIVTVKPGRYDDFLAMTARADQMLEKAGAKNIRLIVGLTAGEASGSMVTTWEAEDFTAYGRVTDKFFANGGAELMGEIGGADSPILGWQGSTYVDVPR
jgi:heme-degrading monooxygenase HmoA